VGEKVGENIKELQEGMDGEDEKERGRNRSGGRKLDGDRKGTIDRDWKL
jgi:hypothetical protein